MSIDQIAAAALQLPPNQRAILAESLWNSLVNPYEYTKEMDETETFIIAQERDSQIELGEVKSLSHAELMAGLR